MTAKNYENQVLQQELGYSIVTTSFNTFLKRAYPLVPRDIFPVATHIIGNLKAYTFQNPKDGFAIVRGGPMRMFLFNTQNSEEKMRRRILDHSSQYIGDDPQTRNVFEYTFPEVTDLDVRYGWPFFTTPADQVRLHEGIRTNIHLSLLMMGFQQTYESSKDCLFESAFYQVKFETKTKGHTHKNTIYKLYFKDKKTGRQVFTLDLASNPFHSPDMVMSDAKFSPVLPSIDTVATGLLRDDGTKIVMDHVRMNNKESERLMFLGKTFEAASLRQGHELQTALDLLSNFRSAGFLGAYFKHFFTRDLDIKKIFSLCMHTWGKLEEQVSPEVVNSWVQLHRAEIESRQMNILSSGLFLETHPIGIAYSYFSGGLAYTPFGRIIGNDLKRIFAVLYSMSEIRREDSDPFTRLIQELKRFGMIAEDVPENLDSAIGLVNPLLLL